MKLFKRIQSISSLQRLLSKGSILIPCLEDPTRFETKIRQIGFSWPLVVGESLVPSSCYGKACEINANGWIEKHKDQPKETAYRQVIWRWKMKRGWDFEEAWRLVDVPYERYPRTEHHPFGMEYKILSNKNGKLIITGEKLSLVSENKLKILTAINSFIEIFGECTILSENLNQIIEAPVRKLNWRILPPGKMPWEELKTNIIDILKKKSEKAQEVILSRFQSIHGYDPDFYAVGHQGFCGYVVFGFKKKKFYLLESIYFGNATYGLGENWEVLSKKTKSDLLNNNLHIFRLVHREGWMDELRRKMT